MTRTWSLSRLRFSSLVVISSLIFSALFATTSNASRGGVEEISNKFSVGFTYLDGSISSVCSGILVSPKLIATARHCVRNDAGINGTNYVFTNPGQRIDGPAASAKLSTVLISDEDLAFIVLDSPLTGAEYIRIADQATIAALPEKSQLFGYGYGAVYETNALYSSRVRKYPLEWTAAGLVPTLKNTYELTSDVASACRGDSGGPIVTALPSGEMVLLAVMSGAANVQNTCGTPGSDGLFRMRVTVVAPYLLLVPDYQFPGVAPKTETITCIKVVKKKTYTKKVTGVKPTCPKGYKLKK